MKILYKYTTRSRPDNFIRGLNSIIQNSVSDNFHILVSIDGDDESMNNYKMRTYLAENKKVTVRCGLSTGKINAINRDLNEFTELCDWDILVNMSDDMVFIEKGFDEVIRESFREGLNQYIHFNDGNQKANVCTMHIVGRDYYNHFKYIYHPDYESLWCDVENDLVAKQLGCYKYMGDNIRLFQHLHPAWGLAPNDAQYLKTEAKEMWIKDEQTFNKRKLNNFYVQSK